MSDAIEDFIRDMKTQFEKVVDQEKRTRHIEAVKPMEGSLYWEEVASEGEVYVRDEALAAAVKALSGAGIEVVGAYETQPDGSQSHFPIAEARYYLKQEDFINLETALGPWTDFGKDLPAAATETATGMDIVRSSKPTCDHPFHTKRYEDEEKYRADIEALRRNVGTPVQFIELMIQLMLDVKRMRFAPASEHAVVRDLDERLSRYRIYVEEAARKIERLETVRLLHEVCLHEAATHLAYLERFRV